MKTVRKWLTVLAIWSALSGAGVFWSARLINQSSLWFLGFVVDGAIVLGWIGGSVHAGRRLIRARNVCDWLNRHDLSSEYLEVLDLLPISDQQVEQAIQLCLNESTLKDSPIQALQGVKQSNG